MYKAYSTKADDNCMCAECYVNDLVPRFVGSGKGFGSRAERGIAKKVFPEYPLAPCPVDLGPPSENSHSVAAQGGEMTDQIARTRQMGTFPVDRENIRIFAGGFGNRLFT